MCVDLRGVVLWFCSKLEISMVSVDTDGKGNVNFSMSPLEDLLVEGT